MSNLMFKPVGIVHSPFRKASDTPIQSAMAKGMEGWIEVFAQFAPGLRDLAGFERIWLIYRFDRTTPAQLVVKPFLDEQEHGVFATRSPCRPNAIGLSCVRLLSVDGNQLHIGDLDVLDETPLLDIKPYVPAFDCFGACRVGWLEGKGIQPVMADDRFEPLEPKPSQC